MEKISGKVAGFTPGLAQILKQSRGSVRVIGLSFSGLANCKADSGMGLWVGWGEGMKVDMLDLTLLLKRNWTEI